MYNAEFCLTGKELQEATYEDAKKKEEEAEREWFQRNKKVGYKWSPPRMEALDIFCSNSDEHYRMEKKLRILSWVSLAEVAAIVVLAFFMLR